MTDINTLLQFLAEGDLFGFFQAIFVMAFLSADIFYGIIAMIFYGAMYIRTKSLALIGIINILIGPFFIAAMPLVAGLGMFLTIFGIAMLLLEVFTSRHR